MTKITTKALFRSATADDLENLVEYVNKPVTGLLDQTNRKRSVIPVYGGQRKAESRPTS